MDLHRTSPSPVAGVGQAVVAPLGEVLSRLQLPDRAAVSALFLGDMVYLPVHPCPPLQYIYILSLRLAFESGEAF